MSMVEQELLFLKHPNMSDPYFSKWFDTCDPNFVLDLRPPDKRNPTFASWFDRYMARRAAASVPVTNRHRFSVCVCVENQPRRRLDDMYKSVLMQSYRNRELVILDNGSSSPETLEWLRGAERAGLAKILRADTIVCPTEARRTLLQNATGDIFVAMNADDFICADALQILACAIEKSPAAKVLYSDEYEADPYSVRQSPFFKPDFDPVMVMNCCYPAGLLAIDTVFLRQLAAQSDHGASWPHDYHSLLATMLSGAEPVHVRELLYARRGGPDWKKDPASQRTALGWFLDERGLDHALSVEPNPLAVGAGSWKLTARKLLPNVEVLNARDAWSKPASLTTLTAVGSKSGVEWVAILLSPDDPSSLLELSALGWLDPRIVAVSGLLTDQSGTLIRWSGGLFLPGGRLLDPYAGKPCTDGGHHGQLCFQRAIDVPAPVNVLIRAKALVEVAARLPEDAGADGLMPMLGLLAHESDRIVATTPHLRDVLPPTSLVLPPLDRQGVVLGAAALERGSRWYDGRLRNDPAYGLRDLA